MSRIGNAPVKIASGVDVKINGSVIEVKGPKGTLIQELPESISVKITDGQIVFVPANSNEKGNSTVKALWGLSRALVNNMVVGVTEGYTKTLEIEGVGFKVVSVNGQKLTLALGFSHEVVYEVAAGVEVKSAKPTEISISGIDKRLVGQVAAEIRAYKKPEPYKGKGIRFTGEYVRRKEGKKK